jgi:DNA-3-methyladenine glycosylase
VQIERSITALVQQECGAELIFLTEGSHIMLKPQHLGDGLPCGPSCKPSANLPDDFFARDAPTVAAALIGTCLLVHGIGGIIVETEAYDATDPASHSYRGPTPRNAPMFGPPGRAYVYRIYGLHWCLNFVCSDGPPGSAVLIRAIQPTTGVEEMMVRRQMRSLPSLCSGPGKLAQALAVDATFNGADLGAPPFALCGGTAVVAVETGPRIGIRHGSETPWRFGMAGSTFLSRPMP